MLPELGDWGRAMADYATTGISVEGNPIRVLRPRLPRTVVSASDLPSLRHGARTAVAGLVVARQRPSTAGGIVFLLLEDETGTINAVIKPRVYERYRLLVRSDPLLLIEGVLERPAAAGGGMSILVSGISSLGQSLGSSASVHDLFDADARERDQSADGESVEVPRGQMPGRQALPRASSGRRGR